MELVSFLQSNSKVYFHWINNKISIKLGFFLFFFLNKQSNRQLLFEKYGNEIDSNINFGINGQTFWM